MRLIDLTCSKCGAALRVDSDKETVFCQHCGAKLLIDDEIQRFQFHDAENAGYQFEKGRQRARAEMNAQYSQTDYRQTQQWNQIQQPPRKRRTWLWVLGWIFMFPIPLTILILKNKNMKPQLKYGIVAVMWLVFLGIGMFGGSDEKSGTENMAARESSIQSQNEVTNVVENDENMISEAEPEPDEGVMTDEPNAMTKQAVLEYDVLQELYVNFPLNVSLVDAVAFLDEYGLPYSNQAWNGGRVIQVSTEEEGTAQRYNKSGLPYISIDYSYATGENSKNDDWEKYSFTAIKYYPKEGYFSFECLYSEKGIIRRLGSDIGQDMPREEQIEFFYKYKDDKNAFK